MRACFAFLLHIVLAASAFGQQGEIIFDRFLQVKGLGQRSITSIIQDDQGFIWLGSTDGLLRFDGYDLKIFKNNLRNNHSLTDNNVRAVASDKNGYLWIATQGGGLDRFDLKTEQFTHFRNDSKNPNSISGNAVWSVFVDQQNQVWAGTFSDGLSHYDQKNKFIRYGQVKDPIMAIAQSSDGRIWFGAKGLNVIDPNTGQTKSYGLQNETSGEVGGVRTILITKAGKIWVGTDEGGIFVFDAASETFSQLSNPRPSANQVYSLFEDQNGKILAGTNAGLIIMDNDQPAEIYQSNPANPLTISNNSVRCLMQDKQGSVWLGLEGGGLNKILERKNFILFRHDPAVATSLSHNLIRSIYDDNQGRIWVGTQGGGLNLYNPAEKIFTVLGDGGKGDFQLSSNQVSSIYQDKSGIMWIGTWGGGLNKVNLETNEVKAYRHEAGNNNSLPDDRVQITYEDKNGELWVGTEDGLARFDKVTEVWKQFRYDKANAASILGNNIQGQAFVESDDGSLWIGTWFGLNRLKPDRKSFDHFTSDTTQVEALSSDHVISLHADHSGNLWIGTFGGGLNQLQLSSGKITQYTEQDGLANNTIYGIKADAEGNLWLSTSNGLSRFNPATKTFRNYDVSEGLQSNEFYWGAAYQARDGSLLFGGINGLNWFKPSDIKDNTQVPPVVITDFQIFNKSVSVGAGSVLQQTINFTNAVELRYDQAVLNFQFRALNFNYPEKNQYAYQLENFDPDWNLVGNKRTATYTNLDPGEYIFRVKGSNNDNVWNEKGVSLKIIITPPFWRTWWFYGLVTIMVVGSIYGFIKYRERELKHDKEALRQSLEQSLQQARDELEKQKQHVEAEQARNKERNWTDQSLAKFGEILSQSRSDVKALCSNLLNALVRHLGFSGGAIYIMDKQQDLLQVEANYGFENLKPVAKGDGLVGVCFDQAERQWIAPVPKDFFKITSGLGGQVPTSLILVPLKYEDTCLGVVELASFETVEEYKVRFVELLAERLTTTINTTIMAQHTERLLQESQHQAEELKVREEELKQNLEELQAINEDRDRKTQELEQQIAELKKS